MESNNNTMPMPSKDKSTGPLVGSIIIIVILIIGGIYLISKSQLGGRTAPTQDQSQTNQAVPAPTDGNVSASGSTNASSSADLNNIQNDLNQTSSGINSASQGTQ